MGHTLILTEQELRLIDQSLQINHANIILKKRRELYNQLPIGVKNDLSNFYNEKIMDIKFLRTKLKYNG